ncbi:MAG: hypothetical protein M3139_10895 [Bacteroidota bacterium]|nr:hypothetical protein [Bacteroidota bacterium]
MIKPKYLILLCLLLLSVPILKAQDKEMFIEQIAGKTITRESFQSDGKLLGKQEFIAEKLQQTAKNFIVNINTKIYDDAGKLKSTYTTAYSCKPGESDVLLSVFTINPKNQKISVSVNSGDFKKLYDLNPGEMMNSLNLTMYVETGILNFLGSKNKVEIANRQLTKENSYWKITEKITIKAYLLGIRIKTITYNVTEYLTTSGQLENQVFKETNGDYFTIIYKAKS